MNKALLLRTLAGENTLRPPVWFMRQAGRVLPSYNLLKERYTFWQLMKDADIGAKVTLLPVHDLGVDAAILFSDILVIPYAMGLGLDFTDNGPVFESPLSDHPDPLSALHPDPSKLNYIYDVIDKIVGTRPPETPLIGFCGAPLTVLCYMLQGLGKNPEFPTATKFMYQQRQTTAKLVEAITEMSVEYATQQINHGVEVFQLFESHAGIIPWELYEEFFLPAVKKIAAAVRQKNIPFIFFPKGCGYGVSKITPDVCDYLSIDWQLSITDARKLVHPSIGLQGNLDPRIFFCDKATIEQHLNTYLPFGRNNQNWIFNLGHGVLPGTPVENVKFVVDWIKNTHWDR